MVKVDIEKLIKPHLMDIKTYEPVDPPELLAEKAGIPKKDILKLNGNENPYGGSPKVAPALSNLEVHIYPDPLQRQIRKALSQYVGIGMEYIIAGAGSDELIDLLFRLFISEGDEILDCDPTFAMYAFCARVAGGSIRLIPRDESFDIDTQAVKSAITDKSKIIFVSSPNNPTGNLATESQILGLLDTGLIVVVDEAYYEFCNQTFANLVLEHENLVILRTMSKWAGLAGLRIGYGIMNPKLVDHIMDIKSPYNVNAAAEAATIASLDDADELNSKAKLIINERDRMMDLIKHIPSITPWPSQGNFILCQFDSPFQAVKVHDGLAAKGIFVRKFSSERLKDCFRVAIGTPEQTNIFIRALKDLA